MLYFCCAVLYTLISPFKFNSSTAEYTYFFLKITQIEKKFSDVDFLFLTVFDWQDCKSAKCKYIKCILKDTEDKSDYIVKVKTRIWSGTFLQVKIFNN